MSTQKQHNDDLFGSLTVVTGNGYVPEVVNDKYPTRFVRAVSLYTAKIAALGVGDGMVPRPPTIYASVATPGTSSGRDSPSVRVTGLR